MEGLINGLMGLNGLNGLGENEERQIENMSDEQFDELVDGLGRYRGRRGYKRGRRKAWGIRNRSKGRAKAKKQDSTTHTSKSLFENRFGEIENASIRKALKDGKATVSDFEIVSTKLSNGTLTEMFVEGDTKKPGIANINNAKLRSGSVMLITHICILEAIGAGETDTDARAADYKIITPATANGDFTFKNGQKTFIDDASLALFKKGELTGLRKGEIKLEVPKMIQDATEIVFNIAPAKAPVANTFYKVLLKGVITNRA